MGIRHAGVIIRNPADHSRFWTGEFVVDTGAVDCLAPRQSLEAIGLAAIGRGIGRRPDGSDKALDFTVAQIELMGGIGGATIYMPDDDVGAVIGRTVLLSMGLEVDQGGQTLVKRPSIPLPGIRRVAEPA